MFWVWYAVLALLLAALITATVLLGTSRNRRGRPGPRGLVGMGGANGTATNTGATGAAGPTGAHGEAANTGATGATGTSVASLSPFIVGTQGVNDFTTIQGGINAAVAAGASAASPRTVYIKTGSYTENITLADGINLVGPSVAGTPLDGLTTFNPLVTVNGTVTVALGVNQRTTITNLTVNGRTTITSTAASSGFSVQQCQMLGGNGSAITIGGGHLNIESSYMAAGLGESAIDVPFGNTISTTIVVADSFIPGNTITVHGSGTSLITLRNSVTGSGVDASLATAACTLNVDQCTFAGTFRPPAGLASTARFARCNMTGAPMTATDNAATVTVIDCTFTSSTAFNSNLGIIQDWGSSKPDSNGVNPSLLTRLMPITGLTDTGMFHQFQEIVVQTTVSNVAAGTFPMDYAIPVPAGFTMLFHVAIAGSLTDHTDTTAGQIDVAVDGTAAAIIGTPTVTVYATSAGTFAPAFAAGALSIEVTPAGTVSPANPYNWVATITRQVLRNNT